MNSYYIIKNVAGAQPADPGPHGASPRTHAAAPCPSLLIRCGSWTSAHRVRPPVPGSSAARVRLRWQQRRSSVGARLPIISHPTTRSWGRCARVTDPTEDGGSTDRILTVATGDQYDSLYRCPNRTCYDRCIACFVCYCVRNECVAVPRSEFIVSPRRE